MFAKRFFNTITFLQLWSKNLENSEGNWRSTPYNFTQLRHCILMEVVRIVCFFYISSGSFSTTQEIDSQINMKYTLHVTEICWQTCFWSVNPDFHKVKVIIFIDVISLKGMSPFSRIYKIYISRMIFNFFARITYSFKNCKSAQNLKFLAFVDFKISRIQ